MGENDQAAEDDDAVARAGRPAPIALRPTPSAVALISGALEAAEAELVDALGWVDDGSMDFEPRETARAAVAPAIAAFLEFFQGPNGIATIYGEAIPERLFPYLATAVRATAKDPRHG